MKKLLAYSLFMALMICSCQVEEIKDVVLETEPETNAETKVFTAIIEDSTSGETKTSLDGSGNVLWKQGDQVSIFAASTVNEQYQVSDDSDGKTAATLNKLGGSGFVAGTEIDNNVAFYPYASTASIAKSGGSYIISDIELPATQSYTEGSFGNGAFPMTAVTNTTADMNLKFKNVLGGLKLQLKGTATIASIKITGNNNEILCGEAEVTVTNGSVPSISLSDASAKTVTLDCGAGVTLDSESATSFIIALPPMTMTGGFTIVVTDTEGKQMEISTSKSQTITRSNLLKMPAVTFVGTVEEYVNLGLPSGTLWAKCNVGALTPEGYGNYFRWGETSPYDKSRQYQFWGGSPLSYTGYANAVTKYCIHPFSGTVDNKIILDLCDDAAYVNKGASWRTPTYEELNELFTYCTPTKTTLNGVSGWLLIGPNGKDIFIPAAGIYNMASELSGVGEKVFLWSSILGQKSETAYRSYFTDSGVSGNDAARYMGHVIRPVYINDPAVGITGVSLDYSSASMHIGETLNLVATVSAKAGALNKIVEWKSSNPLVADVDRTGKVKALAEGTAIISATTVFGAFEATCTVSVSALNIAGRAYVDLGLPSGLKWAVANIGASRAYQTGDRFAWGETETKESYSWSNYIYCEGSEKKLTKYNDSDYKNELERNDDAAYVKWGGSWHMPTKSNMGELIIRCNVESGAYNGVLGSWLTGPNGNFIFIAHSIWSCTLGDNKIFGLCFNSQNGYTSDYRSNGHSIRPVSQ